MVQFVLFCLDSCSVGQGEQVVCSFLHYYKISLQVFVSMFYFFFVVYLEVEFMGSVIASCLFLDFTVCVCVCTHVCVRKPWCEGSLVSWIFSLHIYGF